MDLTCARIVRMLLLRAAAEPRHLRVAVETLSWPLPELDPVTGIRDAA